MKQVERYFLELKLPVENKVVFNKPKNLKITLDVDDDFQINKFFYKNVGKKHRWIDRLTWSDLDWIKYISDPNVETFFLKVKEDLAGYFELIFHSDTLEVEIAYFGLLEEYHNKKLGAYLLSLAIKESFKKKNIARVWVHTCTLDHDNALKNYLARGMTIYKKETIKI